jgi:ketosteroid isomerase-like protein
MREVPLTKLPALAAAVAVAVAATLLVAPVATRAVPAAGASSVLPPSPQSPSAEVLMQADRDFAADVAAGGAAAWASWFAADGAMIQPGLGEVRGRSAILAAMEALDDPQFSLAWTPERADIAASGDLGWTTGGYVSEGVAPDGSARRSEGRYVSIWRLQADGSWKVVMDLGNPVGPPPASSR